MAANNANTAVGISRMGLITLAVLTLQNSCKSIFMRFVMKDQPEFLLSTAIVSVEVLKLVCCVLYIQWVEMKPIKSIVAFLEQEHKSSKLLAVPAACYIIQMSMEYIAFAHIDANVFAVIVQTKMLFTAFFFVFVLSKKMARKQVYSLVILTVGVMLCSMKSQNNLTSTSTTLSSGNTTKGILATLTIALCSGFASVYTEKVIKGNISSTSSTPSMESSKKDLDEPESSKSSTDKDVEMASLLRSNTTTTTTLAHSPISATEKVDHSININSNNNMSTSTTITTTPIKYSLAYTQVQLALVSLILLGIYVILIDHVAIIQKGFFYNFDKWAFLSTVNSAIGGLIVAGVLKYADSVLKNYSTAVSVLITGIASNLIFGTQLPVLYWMGLINVTCSIFLYNASGLDDPMF